MGRFIGIDIGGTKTAVVLGRQAASSIDVEGKVSFPTETAKGLQYTLDRIFAAVGGFVIQSDNTAEAIGISCGGPLDSREGVILSPPNLPGWDAVPIAQLLTERFGIPARLQNDANACALAEWRWGAARGCSNAIFLTFGTGLGAGLILNGRLYEGANGMAGEAGHIRLAPKGPEGYGKAGSFEGFCSGGGIAGLARIMARDKLLAGEKVLFCADEGMLGAINARIVAEAARAGDALALEIYRTSGKYLGMGLSILVDLLNPEVIVIGSIFTRCLDLLWPAAQEALNMESLALSRSVCRVVPSQLSEEIGDMAALAVAACL